MKPLKKFYPWCIILSVFIIFSTLLVDNIIDIQTANIENDFISKVSQTRFSDMATLLEFGPRGILLNDYKNFGLDLPIEGKGSFSIQTRFYIKRMNNIYFKLSGETAKTDVILKTESLSQDWENSYNLLTINKNGDGIVFLLNGKLLERKKNKPEPFTYFEITNLDSFFYLQSMTFSSNNQIISYNFLPQISSVRLQICLIITLAFFFILLVFFDTWFCKERPILCGKIILLFSTPLWAATFFPIQGKPLSFYLALLLIPAFPLAFRWTSLYGNKTRKWMSTIILIFAVLGVTIFCFSELGLGQAFIYEGVILISIYWTAWSISKANGTRVFQGFEKAAISITPISLWPVIAMVQFRDFSIDILAALIFAAFVNLFLFICHSRFLIKSYIPLTMFIALATLATAEVYGRETIFNEKLSPHEFEAMGSPNDFLFYLLGGSFAPGKKQPISFDKYRFKSGGASFFPKPGAYRIIVKGGSNTAGYGIKEEKKTFPAILENCLNKHGLPGNFEVINGGQNGLNLFLLKEFFTRHDVSYHPNLVIFYINWVDSRSIFGPFTLREIFGMDKTTRRKHTNSWNSMSNQEQSNSDEKNRGAPWFITLRKTLRELVIYRALADKVTIHNKDKSKPLSQKLGILKEVNPAKDYKANLIELIEFCKNRGIEIVFVSEVDGWYEKNSNNKRDQIEKIISEVTGNSGVKYYKLHDQMILSQKVKSLFFKTPPYIYHLNEKGHTIVGDKICNYILSNRKSIIGDFFRE